MAGLVDLFNSSGIVVIVFMASLDNVGIGWLSVFTCFLVPFLTLIGYSSDKKTYSSDYGLSNATPSFS